MENYSDKYERLKKDGVQEAIQFFNVQTDEERYLPITDIQIPGIEEGRYMISNYGNVFDTFTGDIRNQFYDKNGYARCSFHTDNGYVTKSIHRTELLVFDYNPNYKNLQVNHHDGNPNNNELCNLEWSTPKENSDHAMLYGLHKMNGEDNPNNKLTEDQVHEICKLIESGKYYDTEIAKMFNVSYVNVSDIHKGKLWVSISKHYDLSKRKPLSLSPEQVHEICKLLEEGKYNNAEIGRMYNTSGNNIMEIRKGKIWTDISKDYNISREAVPKKFTKEQVREICELIQTGEYYDTDIAKMYNTTPTFLRSLRIGQIHTDVTKDYDMTIRKKR